MNALDPAALDGRYKRRVWVECEVLADFPAKSQRLPISRQQKFDSSGIEADAVIERLDLMPFIDTTNDHHADENLKFGDVARVAGKERFHSEGFVRFYNNVHPGRWDIDAWKLVNDPIHLDDDNRIVKGCGLHNHRRVFSVWARKQVPFLVCLFGAHQYDVGNKVNE